ncbi:MAG TPA: BON domain-containing protein [Burkholderiales bacterium]|nr:BON domain-containing protein [Burkholderiales bacterium]
MKPILIALCVASLAGCDALSMGQKKTAEVPAAVTTPATKAPAAEAPKAYARIDPDGELAARVKKALEVEPKIHAAGIDVTAADGTVTLWGTTVNDAERSRAAKLASGVDGVKAVENRLAIVKGS